MRLPITPEDEPIINELKKASVLNSTENILTSTRRVLVGCSDGFHAGGAGNFDILKHHAPLSRKLHCPNVAILTVHEDCGAGAKKEDLIKAKEIAQELFETIHCFYLKLDGTWEEIK